MAREGGGWGGRARGRMAREGGGLGREGARARGPGGRGGAGAPAPLAAGWTRASKAVGEQARPGSCA